MSHIRRRQLLHRGGCIVAVPSVLAQERGRVRTIGGVYNWTKPPRRCVAQVAPFD